MPQTKIATCCYCGTRAALVLQGTDRHELACAACGAPLHDMKMLRASATRDHPVEHRPTPKKRSRPGVTPPGHWEHELPQRRRKRKRKSKSLARKIFKEAFDVLEDILD